MKAEGPYFKKKIISKGLREDPGSKLLLTKSARLSPYAVQPGRRCTHARDPQYGAETAAPCASSASSVTRPPRALGNCSRHALSTAPFSASQHGGNHSRMARVYSESGTWEVTSNEACYQSGLHRSHATASWTYFLRLIK